MKILVTGASGFVGQVLCKTLHKQGCTVIASYYKTQPLDDQLQHVLVGELDSHTDWSAALNGVDVVIHLAARVHVMKDSSQNPLAEFRRVNVEGTRRLADMAAKVGIKRFIYVSSVGVNGADTLVPFNELDHPYPCNDYAISKWEAEVVLHEVSARTGIEIVIVRPPLVYGFRAPGNFALMLKMLKKGFPLPFASVRNLRSFIYVENLVDALIMCAKHPSAAGQTFLVSDGEDISTPDLLLKVSQAMGKRVTLLSCSPVFMEIAGRLFGKSEQLNKLLGNLQINSTKIRRDLGWQPPFSLDEGINLSVKDFIN